MHKLIITAYNASLCIFLFPPRPPFRLLFFLPLQVYNDFARRMKEDPAMEPLRSDTYQFVDIPEVGNYCDNLHPATKKIYIVRDFLEKATHDILVFLDSDAWVQNGAWLDYIITQLIKSKKHGCFSRDPYEARNTYINSGSFILKVNNYTRSMYKTIMEHLEKYTLYHRMWPWDQHYVSEYVFNHREHFNVFVPTILNTPIGLILRHNWSKNQAIYDDPNKIISYTREERVTEDLKAYPFRLTDYLDSEPFPN